MEGHRETKQRFYGQSSTDKGIGRDTGLWYEWVSLCLNHVLQSGRTCGV